MQHTLIQKRPILPRAHHRKVQVHPTRLERVPAPHPLVAQEPSGAHRHLIAARREFGADVGCASRRAGHVRVIGPHPLPGPKWVIVPDDHRTLPARKARQPAIGHGIDRHRVLAPRAKDVQPGVWMASAVGQHTRVAPQHAQDPARRQHPRRARAPPRRDLLGLVGPCPPAPGEPSHVIDRVSVAPDQGDAQPTQDQHGDRKPAPRPCSPR